MVKFKPTQIKTVNQSKKKLKTANNQIIFYVFGCSFLRKLSDWIKFGIDFSKQIQNA
jgi:hypothetical protein